MDTNPLAHYLGRKGISQGEFGRSVGAARGVVSRWCRAGLIGGRIPDRFFANAIERETKGAVPASVWDGIAPIVRSARRAHPSQR